MKLISSLVSYFHWILLWLNFKTLSSQINDMNFSSILVDFAPDIPAKKQLSAILAFEKLWNEVFLILRESLELTFEDIILRIPSSWDIVLTSESTKFLPITNANFSVKSFPAHISVVNSAVFDTPTSIQHQGCGKKGQRVTLPLSFLFANEENKGKLLTREWIKYRYGVFDENGFPNDYRYPEYFKIPGTETIYITNCADVPIRYKFSDKIEKERCSFLSVNETSGLPLDDALCTFEVNPKFNTKVQSSLLDRNICGLENVNTLCDNIRHPHNSHSPSKQNLFCEGKSTWDIITEHDDFLNQRLMSDYNHVRFHIVKKQGIRIVLVLDHSKGLENEKSLLTRAICTLIYILPDGSHFSFIKFKDNVDSKFQLTPLNDEVRESILSSEMSLTFHGENSEPKLAIESAVEELVPDLHLQTGSIIIITSTLPPAELNKSTLEKCKYLCLIVITFKRDIENKYFDFLKNNDFSECSRVINIENDNFSSFKKIIHTFNTVIDQELSSDDSPLLVKGQELSKKLPLSFVIDKNVKTFDLILSSNKIGIDLDENSVIFLANHKHFRNITLFFKHTEKGIMKFRVKSKKDSNWDIALLKNRFLAHVLIKRKKKAYYGFSLKVWTEYAEPRNDGFQEPVILYAEVLYGSYPVIHARVKAKIVLPEKEEKEIELFDNGVGDVDITKNDGIYARYFVHFSSKGNYRVEVTADDNRNRAKIGYKSSFHFCCGSEISYKTLEHTGKFSIIANTLFSISKNAPEFGYGPSKIQDLRVFNTNKSFMYTFTWTSPGNEGDYGLVQFYNMTIFNTLEDAYKLRKPVKEFSLNEIITPKLYSEIQIVDINISEGLQLRTMYYILLQTKNYKGIESKPSNIVNIFLAERQVKGKLTTLQKVSIALGSIFCAMLLVIIIYIIVFYKNIKREKNPIKPSAVYSIKSKALMTSLLEVLDKNQTLSPCYKQSSLLREISDSKVSVRTFDNDEIGQSDESLGKKQSVYDPFGNRQSTESQSIDSDFREFNEKTNDKDISVEKKSEKTNDTKKEASKSFIKDIKSSTEKKS